MTRNMSDPQPYYVVEKKRWFFADGKWIHVFGSYDLGRVMSEYEKIVAKRRSGEVRLREGRTLLEYWREPHHTRRKNIPGVRKSL